MTDREQTDRELKSLDRHALVMALWLGFAFVAVTLLKLGIDRVNLWALSLGFASALMGFIAHVLVNIVFKTLFTPKEVALGLFVFAYCAWFRGAHCRCDLHHDHVARRSRCF